MRNYFLRERKHILLSEKSDYGWTTIVEYKKHSLADDSDDEKRIIKAESRTRASVNVVKKKKKSSAPAESSAPSQSKPIPSLVPAFQLDPNLGHVLRAVNLVTSVHLVQQWLSRIQHQSD